jgi:hypothetical protein
VLGWTRPDTIARAVCSGRVEVVPLLWRTPLTQVLSSMGPCRRCAMRKRRHWWDSAAADEPLTSMKLPSLWLSGPRLILRSCKASLRRLP